MVTGESLPTDKNPGDQVIGATINKTGAFRFRATNVGADMALASIVRIVGDAQATKLPIQRIVDQVGGRPPEPPHTMPTTVPVPGCPGSPP